MPELDSASMIIGELKGQFSGLEQYIHQQFHSLRNEDQIKYTYFEKILKELKDLREADHRTNAVAHNELEARVDALEAVNTRRNGALGLFDYILRSPLVGWIVAIGAGVWAIIAGRGHS